MQESPTMQESPKCPHDIGTEDFYNEMRDLMSSAEKQVWLYSVSACFGFYSRGLNVFESLYGELRSKLQIKLPAVDVRCLIKLDDHGIDEFAAGHFQELNHDREVVRQLRDLAPAENLQFVLTDIDTPHPNLLYSEVQEVRTTPVLRIDINKLRGGVLYDFDCETMQKFRDLFESKWNSSGALSVVVHRVALDKLVALLKTCDLASHPQGEHCISHNLAYYLRGVFGSQVIQTEETCKAGRFDVVVASGTRKIAIEVKYGLARQDFDTTVGQVVKYRQNCDSVILLSVQPRYNQYDGVELEKRLHDSRVEFVERR